MIVNVVTWLRRNVLNLRYVMYTLLSAREMNFIQELTVNNSGF